MQAMFGCLSLLGLAAFVFWVWWRTDVCADQPATVGSIGYFMKPLAFFFRALTGRVQATETEEEPEER